MHAAAATGIGFLLSVLWFDLMFDVQVRGHREPVLPAEVRDSIAAYYRRVTTAARPMNRLIAVAMLVTLFALAGEVAGDDVGSWVAWTSLVLAASAIGLAGARDGAQRGAARRADRRRRDAERARTLDPSRPRAVPGRDRRHARVAGGGRVTARRGRIARHTCRGSRPSASPAGASRSGRSAKCTSANESVESV